MAHPQTHWSLATFAQGDQAVAALEVDGLAYRLAPSLARVGLTGQDSVAGLFTDWERALAALNAAATQVQASDLIPASPRLAPLLYPGKILCAGAIPPAVLPKSPPAIASASSPTNPASTARPTPCALRGSSARWRFATS